jgi:hypothetical protein
VFHRGAARKLVAMHGVQMKRPRALATNALNGNVFRLLEEAHDEADV